MKIVVTIIIIEILTFLSTALSAQKDFTKKINSIVCGHQVLSTINVILQKHMWYPTIEAVPGENLYSAISFRDTRYKKSYKIWSNSSKSSFLESDLNENRETLKTWSKNEACLVKTSVQKIIYAPLPTNVGFNDQDLAQIMNRNKLGVIYIWSPSMPLSVKGLSEIRAAVKETKGMKLTVLLDAKASIDAAKGLINQGLIQSSDLTQVASNELYARDIAVHYPILLIYKDQFLSNNSYVGFKSSEVYKEWFQKELINIKEELFN